jgi:hypothetical protein
MAASLPDSSCSRSKKKAISKSTEDKAGQEVLQNVFCTAEACEEFSRVLVLYESQAEA